MALATNIEIGDPRTMLEDDLYDTSLVRMSDGTMRKYRSVYPAEMTRLPPRQDARLDRYEWRTNIVRRLQIDDLDRVAASTDELRDHKDSHWIWCGAHQPDGRAMIRIAGKHQPVTRVLWTLFRGGSPDTRRVLKRMCAHEGCVNPWHRELVKRGSWQQKSTSGIS